MNDDGTMARRNDLITFAQRHGLKIGTIADLIAYRRRYDSIVKRLSETTFESIYGGDFRCVIYVNKVTMAQHIALVKGDPAAGGPVTVRMHAVNIFTDALGQRDTGRGGEIEASMREIAKEGRGVIVLIREPLTVMLSEQRRRAGEPIRAGRRRAARLRRRRPDPDRSRRQGDGAADQQQEERGRPRGLRPQDRRPEAGSRPPLASASMR